MTPERTSVADYDEDEYQTIQDYAEEEEAETELYTTPPLLTPDWAIPYTTQRRPITTARPVFVDNRVTPPSGRRPSTHGKIARVLQLLLHFTLLLLEA